MWLISFDVLTVTKKKKTRCSIQIAVIKVGKVETSIKESTNTQHKCNKY